ncbi:MAG: PAS domain S-box protein [Labilithrix sp.]|nr:PAS domain S-box protein [Labilithrix sp.]MCW5810174.1 PAS domain S-box protein [Labilithrix sp.]
MLLSARPIRMLLEAVEAVGLDPDPMLAAAGIDRDALTGDAHQIPWSAFVRLNEAVSASVEHDPARLRAIGAAMGGVPSYAPLRRLARTVISVRMFYDISERWFARASFPHLRAYHRFEAGDRLFIHGTIPPSYEACEAFLHVASGAMVALPIILDLPASTLVASRIDGRTLDVELVLPRSPSVFSAGFQALSALTRIGERADALEDQRRWLDAGLHASERARDELRNVLERLPALVVIHVQGRIVFANRAFARALGFARAEELVGRPLVDSIDPRSRALFAARLRRPLETGVTEEERTEAWLMARDGSPVRVEVSATQGIAFDGVPARLVVGRDLGEHDRLQRQLATADRLAAVGLLAAGVAHEVNNPLAYLLNNIEIAKKQLGAEGPVDAGRADTARTALQIALEGAARIGFIVRELLLLAREDPAPAATADLAAAVESTLALARVEIARTAKLSVHLDAVPLVRGSVPRIAQIVLNLVLNALEAMRHRDAADNELTLRVRRGVSTGVMLEVGDNGVGVSAPDAERIFHPFFTTKPPGRGTGLGLAVTQRLVAELGGEISFSSEPDRGTTFRVLFRVAEEDEPAVVPARASAPRVC